MPPEIIEYAKAVIAAFDRHYECDAAKAEADIALEDNTDDARVTKLRATFDCAVVADKVAWKAFKRFAVKYAVRLAEAVLIPEGEK